MSKPTKVHDTEPKSPPTRKNLRELLKDDDEKNEKKTSHQLSEEVKNMLIAGSLMNKHAKYGSSNVRHIFVTPDLKYLVWKDPKDKEAEEGQRLKIFKIKSVERGRCTPALQKKKPFGGFVFKEECCFAVMASDRTVDLETATESERDRWVLGLQTLVSQKKQQNQESSYFN